MYVLMCLLITFMHKLGQLQFPVCVVYKFILNK